MPISPGCERLKDDEAEDEKAYSLACWWAMGFFFLAHFLAPPLEAGTLRAARGAAEDGRMSGRELTPLDDEIMDDVEMEVVDGDVDDADREGIMTDVMEAKDGDGDGDCPSRFFQSGSWPSSHFGTPTDVLTPVHMAEWR